MTEDDLLSGVPEDIYDNPWVRDAIALLKQLATERARADNAEADNEKLLTASNYEAERAAGFEKDARRYRWLLDKSWFQAAVRYYIAFNGSNLSDSDTTETIIDKAMKDE